MNQDELERDINGRVCAVTSRRDITGIPLEILEGLVRSPQLALNISLRTA